MHASTSTTSCPQGGRTWPDRLTVAPLTGAFDVRLSLPGSKSLTNRALLLAALAQGSSELQGVLSSDDSQVMLEALQTLGLSVTHDPVNATAHVQGCPDGRLPDVEVKLFLGNAGTAFRFLTAACALGRGRYVLEGVERMHERPIGPLVDLLRELGGEIRYLGREGFPPLAIEGRGLRGGHLRVRPTLSSQYISAILQIAPLLPGGLTLEIDGPMISWPYVRMTLGLMRTFLPTLPAPPDNPPTRLTIAPGHYRGQPCQIEPDASNASYFLAAAAMHPGSRCVIEHLGHHSLQGDVQFAAQVLKPMGADVMMGEDTITVQAAPQGRLRALDVDLGDMPDMAQTLAVLALFADGPTSIRNIGNLRVKETDRLAALQQELSRFGALVRIDGDDLHIQPPAADAAMAQQVEVETYDDHRMAMAFALAGLGADRLPGGPQVILRDPQCVCKTFPTYFEYLDLLRKRKRP